MNTVGQKSFLLKRTCLLGMDATSRCPDRNANSFPIKLNTKNKAVIFSLPFLLRFSINLLNVVDNLINRYKFQLFLAGGKLIATFYKFMCCSVLVAFYH